MKNLEFLGLALFLVMASCSQKEQPPDVLFIAIDDLNDWVTPLDGRENMQTPNLDGLVARGMLFENAHCTAPACCPSRTSVMTGVRPSTSGIYSNTQEWRKSPVLRSAKTIPEFFRERGYTVKGGGKIFHALSWIQTAYGIDQNDPGIWDEYYPSLQRSLPPSVWPESFQVDEVGTVTWENVAGAETKNRPPYFFDWGPLGAEEDMADYKVVDWAVKELKEERDKPLFLAVGIFRPHIPWFAPPQYFELYPPENRALPLILENDLDDVSSVSFNWLRRSWQRWMIENDLWKSAVQGYEACISFSDAMLGRLLRGLEESGNAENTIIVLWSDHGMHIGEKEQWEKFTLWEESTRVPLVFVAPGVTSANTRSAEAVSLLDVYPTLVGLVGGERPDQLEGLDLSPILRDPSLQREEPAITTYHKDNHSVRTERWRYIQYHNGDRELYDHESDPDEFHNLAGDPRYGEVIEGLQRWIPPINADEQ